MVLFQNKVAQLQTKSDNILDVFTKTIRELNAVNEEATTAVTEKRAEAAQLMSDAKSMEDMVTKNEKVIGKINSIIAIDEEE